MKIRLLQTSLFILAIFTNAVLFAAAPTVQASNLSITEKTCTSFKLSFTRGNGTGVLVTCRLSSSAESKPVDGVNYLSNSTFQNGADLGNSNYVIFKGSANVITVQGLLSEKEYTLQVYEYDATNYEYLTSTAASITDSTHYLKANPTWVRINNDSCAKSAKLQLFANITSSYTPSKLTWKSNAFPADVEGDSAIVGNLKFGSSPISVLVAPNMGCLNVHSTSTSPLIVGVPTARPRIVPGGPCLPFGKLEYSDSSLFPFQPSLAVVPNWYFGDGDHATKPKGDHTYVKAGYYDVTYVAKTLYNGKETGCNDTMIIKNVGAPVFKFSPLPCFDSGQLYNVQSPVKASTYSWNYSKTDTGFQYVVSQSGYLHLTITDTNQCAYSDSVKIESCAVSSTQNHITQYGISIIAKDAGLGLTNNHNTPQDVFIYSAQGQVLQQLTLQTNETRTWHCRSGLYIAGNKKMGFQWYFVP